MQFADYDLMMGLLRILSRSDRSQHIESVIGAPHVAGQLEGELGVKDRFDAETRAQAYACARELEEARLIVPTYADLSSPREWMIITEAGRVALERGALDALDEALFAVSPTLIEMRRGAWRSAKSNLPDAARHAATSARELLTQVLHALSPDAAVKGQPGYKAKDGRITRRDRLKFAISQRSRGKSDSDLAIAETAADLMEAVYTKLSVGTHDRGRVDQQDIIDHLRTAEVVLRKILI